MNLKDTLERMGRSSIVLDIGTQADYVLGGTRFGGAPDVPPDFEWPTFAGENCDGVTAVRPLAFLAQFNCGELAPLDPEGLLPHQGVLSFFYEVETQAWGYDPADRGCARVFWFPEADTLIPAELPQELGEEGRFPMCAIRGKRELSFPGWEDFSAVWPEADDEAFEQAQEQLKCSEPESRSQLLGWPDVIQNSMAVECELVGRGYNLGGDWEDVPEAVQRQAEQAAVDRWQLLFQLDTVERDDFCLMFGDCGRIYFYIPKEDLAERRFDRVWLILQCF